MDKQNRPLPLTILAWGTALLGLASLLPLLKMKSLNCPENLSESLCQAIRISLLMPAGFFLSALGIWLMKKWAALASLITGTLFVWISLQLPPLPQVGVDIRPLIAAAPTIVFLIVVKIYWKELS